MGVPAIRAEGLSKRYDSADAPAGLTLEVAEGKVIGYPEPNGAGKTATIRLLLGLARPHRRPGGGLWPGPPAKGRRSSPTARQLPGEGSLWPSLTGAETLRLLGRVQARVGAAYRDELINRVDLDPSKKVRACSKGNRQKILLIGALAARPQHEGALVAGCRGGAMTVLLTEPHDFGDSQAVAAVPFDGTDHIIEPVRLDNRGSQFHGPSPLACVLIQIGSALARAAGPKVHRRGRDVLGWLRSDPEREAGDFRPYRSRS
jgi:ABC-type transport system involved in cytochrome c biogenesis ATPase subunit